MESLHHDIAPYNIRTTLVEPGFFHTELLLDASTTWPEPTIDDYAERTATTVEAWKNINGQQPGDPAKLAHALLILADQDQPSLRFLAGADAIEGATAKARELLAQAEAPPRARRQPGTRRHQRLKRSRTGGPEPVAHITAVRAFGALPARPYPEGVAAVIEAAGGEQARELEAQVVGERHVASW